MTEPHATYRLQLGPGLDFAAATGLVDQLADLGVSHLYLSPVLRAVPGSSHGYDVADPSMVSPSLGGEQGLRALAARARERGLGLVADIVPNHGGAHWSNPAWDALLAEGATGPAARWFDVDWCPALPGAAGRVILPVLGEQYGQVLAAGALHVERDCHEHGPYPWRLRYHDHDFPLSPVSAALLERDGTASLQGEPGEPATWRPLHELIEAQHYRPVHWRAGHALVNYRRFFAVDTLAALRVEDPQVFEATHATVLRLLDDGVLDGVRIDHPDGLRDPARYLHLLREQAGEAWIVVEKIVHCLGEHRETLPDWPVAGTTGYEFCNEVLGLFVDPACLPTLDQLDRELGGDPDAFAEVALAAKRELLATDLAAEHRRLTAALWKLAQRHLELRDLDDRELGEALAATLAHLEVYRPYVDTETGQAAPEQIERVERAVARARRDSAISTPAWRVVGAAATGLLGRDLAHLDVVARFAQLAAAVTAKGVEDTAFYRHRRLLALNEVGGEPTRMGMDVAEFHRRNAERAARHPLGMLTTATHDTKRGEDTRLRMAAISERPDEWAAFTRRWAGGAPDGQTATLVLQTLAGVWPLDAEEPGQDVRRRLHDGLRKAQREARLRTDWRDPDEMFEHATAAWLDGLLADASFVRDAAETIRPLQEIAMAAGLAQVLLRCTAPGMPDTYQGCELWEDSLVDPDNRRSVDFASRAALLEEIEQADPAELWVARRDGRIKLWVLSRALRLRRDRSPCFGRGSGYEPIPARGALAAHVVAFARTAPSGDRVVTVAPRLPGRVLADGWGDTELALPPGPWFDVLARRPAEGGELAGLSATLPVALLVRPVSLGGV